MNITQEAKRVLKKTTTPNGFTAGTTHFKDVWARDAFYAGWGALTVGMHQEVQNTLHAHLIHQAPDGQIPMRIGRKSFWLSYLGLPTAQGAVFSNDKNSTPALDPNTLYIITLDKYVQKTKDKELAKVATPSIESALKWLKTFEKNNLLREKPYASWDDAIQKQGASIYNNALYYAALLSASRLTKIAKYKQHAKKVLAAIRKELWNGKYFRHWEGIDVLDVPGNLLAIYLGVANAQEKKKILSSLTRFKQEHGDILPHTCYPKLKWNQVYVPYYLIHMADYQNHGPYWTWVAALELVVRGSDQKLREALTKSIQAAGGIYETYKEPGVPLKRLFYKSEIDFAWTAGILLLTKDRL